MKDCNHSSTFILVLEKGEEIVENIINFCKANNISGAWVSGLGAVSEIDLALYNLDKKEYSHLSLYEPLELLSLNGNIGIKGKEKLAHLHAIVSDSSMKAFGGHMNKAVVAATCEIKLEAFDFSIIRKHSKEIGLNLITNCE